MVTGVIRPTGSMPAEVTSFVGRRRELSEARRLISASRLLTLTGPGGVGKTRIAMRLADQLRRAFDDGVRLVELDPLDDPELLPQTVSESLGIIDSSDDALSIVADFVKDKQLLLVIDNCEHLLAASAMVVSALLAAAPELRVIATSRHVLGIEGEQILPVPPLPMPEANPTGGAALQHDAIRLFADRASAVLPDFTVDEQNVDRVVQICQQLDGMPLAIELAAVRLRTLSLDDILHRLDDRFGLLVAGSRTAPVRQQTLGAAVGWSYDLCPSVERTLWSRLAVFAGGFDLDAAEQVAGDDGIEPAEVIRLLSGLVDQSIVLRETDSSGLRARYHMLETIRRYGLDRLRAAGKERTVRTRHLAYFRRLALRYRDERFSPQQIEWIERLTAEHANLRVALEFGLDTPGQTEPAMELASLLWNFWFAGGFLVEGHRWLLKALAANPAPSAARVKALWSCAFVTAHRGDREAAAAMVAECTALADEYGDERLQAGLAFSHGQVALLGGDLQGAAASLDDAVRRYGAVGDEQGLADSYILLAAVRFFLRDVAGCADAATRARDLCIERDARWTRAYAEWAVALSIWLRGEHAEAAALVQRSIRERHQVGDWTALAYQLELLSWCTAGLGRHDRVAELLGATTAAWRLSGGREDEAPPYHGIDEQVAAQARAALGADVFEAARARGAAMSADEIVATALETKPGSEQAREETRPRAGPSVALTRREQQIAELVAEGLTNRQIAARLTISQRTAEGHVEKVLVKLAFTSRAQIAAWVAEQRAG